MFGIFKRKPDLLYKSAIDKTACPDCPWVYEIHQVDRGWFRWGHVWKVQGGSAQMMRCCKIQEQARKIAAIKLEHEK